MNNDATKLIHDLDLLLDAERAALLSGNLGHLADLVDEKEALITALNAAEFAEDVKTSEINTKVERNQILLEHALSGIRAVAKKLATLRQVRKCLDTYDHNGRRNRIGSGDGASVEKRA